MLGHLYKVELALASLGGFFGTLNHCILNQKDKTGPEPGVVQVQLKTKHGCVLELLEGMLRILCELLCFELLNETNQELVVLSHVFILQLDAQLVLALDKLIYSHDTRATHVFLEASDQVAQLLV